MTDLLPALQASAERLRALVDGLGPEQLEQPAYPSEWTIAQVLSHLGSGAVIMQRRIEDSLAGVETAEDLPPSVWAEWDAKSPAEQAADALPADRALVERFASLTAEERARVRMALGPVQIDHDRAVGLRLCEHALHSWDVAVALDPTATLPADSTAAVLRHLPLVAGFAGRPADVRRTVTVVTTAPAGRYQVALGPEGAPVTAVDGDDPADLTLPAEAFVRLVYGRLDPDHTPPFDGDPATLDALRRAFPGF